MRLTSLFSCFGHNESRDTSNHISSDIFLKSEPFWLNERKRKTSFQFWATKTLSFPPCIYFPFVVETGGLLSGTTHSYTLIVAPQMYQVYSQLINTFPFKWLENYIQHPKAMLSRWCSKTNSSGAIKRFSQTFYLHSTYPHIDWQGYFGCLYFSSVETKRRFYEMFTLYDDEIIVQNKN